MLSTESKLIRVSVSPISQFRACTMPIL